MARIKTFQVQDNRVRFVCTSCKARRCLPVLQHVRTRKVKCHKCGTYIRFNINRRTMTRENQSGKAVLTLSSGRELPIDLHDVSPRGVGIDMKPGDARFVSVSDEVNFKCNWNPRLLTNGRYIVRSIRGGRIGIENVAYRGWG